SFCENSDITAIECRDVLTKTPHDQAGDKDVVCDMEYGGLMCINAIQEDGNVCNDYEVRVLCEPIGCKATTVVAPPSSTPRVSTSGPTTVVTTPSPFPTTTAPECFYNGAFYPPGTIEEGPCHKVVCTDDGEIISGEYYDRPGCGEKFSTTPETTVPPTTVPLGCFYNDQFYAPGTTIEESVCHIVICNENGFIIRGDYFNKPECEGITTPPHPPSTTGPTIPEGGSTPGVTGEPEVSTPGVTGEPGVS
ncbi:unnamed protein product, partial [Owenia fusiformis]